MRGQFLEFAGGVAGRVEFQGVQHASPKSGSDPVSQNACRDRTSSGSPAREGFDAGFSRPNVHADISKDRRLQFRSDTKMRRVVVSPLVGEREARPGVS